MTRYQIDIEKIVGSETWTNVYHCEVASIGAAQTLAGQIKDAERVITCDQVTFVGARVRQAGAGHVGVISLYGQLGSRATSGAAMLPLFNCVRIDFVNGTNRPARKYLRGCLILTDIAPGFIYSNTVKTAVTTYADTLLALSGLVDPQGRTLTARSVVQVIAMHQLRRGNRARSVLP
jgi:hypothetical protein